MLIALLNNLKFLPVWKLLLLTRRNVLVLYQLYVIYINDDNNNNLFIVLTELKSILGFPETDIFNA